MMNMMMTGEGMNIDAKTALCKWIGLASMMKDGKNDESYDANDCKMKVWWVEIVWNPAWRLMGDKGIDTEDICTINID